MREGDRSGELATILVFFYSIIGFLTGSMIYSEGGPLKDAIVYGIGWFFILARLMADWVLAH